MVEETCESTMRGHKGSTRKEIEIASQMFLSEAAEAKCFNNLALFLNITSSVLYTCAISRNIATALNFSLFPFVPFIEPF